MSLMPLADHQISVTPKDPETDPQSLAFKSETLQEDQHERETEINVGKIEEAVNNQQVNKSETLHS